MVVNSLGLHKKIACDQNRSVTNHIKMKPQQLVFIILATIFVASCQPPVVFGDAQPVDTEVFSSIPNSYRGIYWCRIDSASLYVDDHSFIKRKELLVHLTKSEIGADPNLELQNGELFVESWGQSFPIEVKGDTIISSLIIRDTLFAIGPNQIVKPFKGHLILNTKLKENAWGVVVASLKGEGILSMARAELPENLTSLDSIVPVKTMAKRDNNETQILIRPTKEQFEKILQQRLLFDGTCTEFERIIPLRRDVY
jgi:hypothetical protein